MEQFSLALDQESQSRHAVESVKELSISVLPSLVAHCRALRKTLCLMANMDTGLMVGFCLSQ